MHAIDTNVLVRLIVRDDAGQAARADEFVAGGAWVPTLVLAETIWVLSSVYGLSAGEQAQTVEMLLDHGDLSLEHHDAVEKALDLFRSKPSLGFTDCLVLRLAHKHGHVPLGTFDGRLSRLPGTQRL